MYYYKCVQKQKRKDQVYVSLVGWTILEIHIFSGNYLGAVAVTTHLDPGSKRLEACDESTDTSGRLWVLHRATSCARTHEHACARAEIAN